MPNSINRLCFGPLRQRLLAIGCIVSVTSCSAKSATIDPRDPKSPLRLVRTISLPNVRGRIDHMALNTKSNHLFVAEVDNGSVDEVDLASGAVIGRISDLREPQGVARTFGNLLHTPIIGLVECLRFESERSRHYRPRRHLFCGNHCCGGFALHAAFKRQTCHGICRCNLAET